MMTEEEKRDIMAESRREQEEESRVTVFDDWLSDNIISLRQDFLEDYTDEFNSYCKDRFKER